jgi:hypothetical protein
VSHGNARTTVHGRQLIVDRYAAGWTQAHIAAAMGSLHRTRGNQPYVGSCGGQA